MIQKTAKALGTLQMKLIPQRTVFQHALIAHKIHFKFVGEDLGKTQVQKPVLMVCFPVLKN